MTARSSSTADSLPGRSGPPSPTSLFAYARKSCFASVFFMLESVEPLPKGGDLATKHPSLGIGRFEFS